MEELAKFVKEIGPQLGVLGAICIAAAVYLYRENGRLRQERNDAIAKKDQDLKDIALAKDEYAKQLTQKFIDLQEKSINTSHELAVATSAQTDVSRVLVESVKEVLINVKK